jgi:hypothetical protein
MLHRILALHNDRRLLYTEAAFRIPFDLTISRSLP